MSQKWNLQQLPIFPDMVERLNRGESPRAIATWIQSAGHCKNVKHETLRKRIERFWKPHKENLDQQASLAEAGDIPELAKLQKLAELQMSRIEMMHKKETEINHTLDSVRRDIAELKGIYTSIIEIKSKTAPKKASDKPDSQTNIQVNIDARQGSLDDKMAEVIENPASRRKLLNVMKELTSPEVAEDEAQRRRFYVGTRNNVEPTPVQ